MPSPVRTAPVAAIVKLVGFFIGAPAGAAPEARCSTPTGPAPLDIGGAHQPAIARAVPTLAHHGPVAAPAP